MIKLKDNNILLSILPSSIKNDPKITTSAQALNSQLREISSHVDDGMYLYKLDELPSAVLDHLAMQWDADVWRDTWPLHIKRQALKTLISEKTRQGTVSAVKNSLSSLGSAAFITEWFERTPPATPHTFIVSIYQNEIEGIADEELIYDIKRSINAAKPVRSQYSIAVIQTFKDDIYVSGAARSLAFARISQSINERDEARTNAYIVGSTHSLSFIRISNN